ncbi:HAUS augmin-like complex subunit 6 N-terminus-domain-containing protein [Xylariaceae sp. FL0594]|nr:HAUS augmin-like complex subunit 6 N-terminus-domain-containing protein [Xylariaceae sp. FL0594]
MSAYQTNSSLARTRSVRAPATAKPSTLTAPETSAAPSHPTAVISKSTQIPTCTSNVLLFLTNLRLLDLDHEPDWPDTTPTTFSAKDAGGGQKRRVQCVEWALYQLFLLWDHNDAQNKLRPFYPPADQVQSINLRSALVRSLEQAKKNGVLGRDVVIRKTMLDECKGERLEEVLAVFSSAVLKKTVAERALNAGPGYRRTISESIALENWGYAGDRTELNGLLLAHKASLRAAIDRKNAARSRYRDFEELLALKEKSVARRREQLKLEAEKESAVDMSDMAKSEIHRILRNNWTGSERWLDALVLGDSSPRKSGLLSKSFDEVWDGVQTGNITDLEEQSSSLLEQLDKRVDGQKARLQKLEELRKKMFGDVRPPRTAPVTPVRGEKNEEHRPLQFNKHQNLDPNDPEIENFVKFDNPPPVYVKLLDDLRAEVQELQRTKIPDFSSLAAGLKRRPAGDTTQFVSQAQGQEEPEVVPEPETHREREPEPEPEPEPAEDPVSEISEWEDEPEDVVPGQNARGNGHSRQSSIPSLLPGPRRQLPRLRSTREDRRSPIRRSNSTLESSTQAHRRSKTEQSQTSASGIEEQRSRPILHGRDSRVRFTDSPEEDEKEAEKGGKSTSHANYEHKQKIPLSSSSISPPPAASTANKEPAQASSTLPDSRPTSPTQLLADHILASMNDASPSPVKKSRYTLSLAERTRMSMSMRSRSRGDDEDESPERSPMREHTTTQTQTQIHSRARNNTNTTHEGLLLEEGATPGEEEEEEYNYEDLMTRTRRSMAGFEAARQKAQLERRRSERRQRQNKHASSQRKGEEEGQGSKSRSSCYPLFPRLDEEEGDMLQQQQQQQGEEDYDYEAVFKSRPRIDTSPGLTPTANMTGARRRVFWDDEEEEEGDEDGDRR